MEEGRSFTGREGTQTQDQAVQISMAPLFDRPNEHPVAPADAAIVRYRHLLREEAARIAAGGPAEKGRGLPLRHRPLRLQHRPRGDDWHELVGAPARSVPVPSRPVAAT